MARRATLSLEKQKEAASLYRSGMSAPQIARHFGVGLDATYYALRHQNEPRRSARETNQIRFEAKPLSYKLKLSLTPEEEALKQAGVMLYWAEGYKVGKNTVDFANSDPEMALIFRRFLSEICRVDESRVGAHLYCYKGQNIPALITFWSDVLNIPQSKFIKPYVKRGGDVGPRGPRMVHGLVHIRYCDKKLLRQILQWIDEYRQELTRRW